MEGVKGVEKLWLEEIPEIESKLEMLDGLEKFENLMELYINGEKQAFLDT